MRFVFISLSFLLLGVAWGKSSVDYNEILKTKVTHKINNSLITNEYHLPNGLAVFLTENKRAPNVVVGHWVKAGSLHEKPGITGIAHLFEHMMFRPLAPGKPGFFQIASKLGGDLNASTRFESTYYYTAVAPKNLNQLLKVESDRFKNLVVTDALIDVERKAVWSEYSTKFDANPVVDLWFQTYQQAYVGHPFGWMIIGFREDLEKIKASDCNEFFQKYYKPNNIGLFVTGNFKSNDALKNIINLYSDWERGVDSKLPPAFSQKTEEFVGEGKLPSSSNDMMFGFRTPYFDKENAMIQALVNDILFDSKNGLLKKRLVDSKKLASEVSEFNFGYDNGLLKASITLLPSVKISDVRDQVAKIKDDFKSMSNENFTTYKKNIYITTAEGFQRNMALAEFLAKSWGKYGDINITSKYLLNSIDVTRDQVQNFLDTYYQINNFVFLTHKNQIKKEGK